MSLRPSTTRSFQAFRVTARQPALVRSEAQQRRCASILVSAPEQIPTLSCKALCATRVEVGTLIAGHKATAFSANTPERQGD